MLYEMFTGTPAFRADNAVAVALKQMREEPVPPHEVEPNVPVLAERVILKCLEKEPEQRFQSVADLESALRPPAPVVSPPRPISAAVTTDRGSSGLLHTEVPVRLAPRRSSAIVWVVASLILCAAALGVLHGLAVVKASQLIQPPAAAPAPKPPDFAYEIPAPPPPEPKVEDAEPPATEVATPTPKKSKTPAPVKSSAPAPAKTAASTPAKANPAPPEVFPRMETGPARKKVPSPAQKSTEQNSPTAAANALSYLWVGRFERGEKARATAKKIEDMDLPAMVIPRHLASGDFFAVFCGPIETKKVSSVMQRLEEKGFSNVRSVASPTANRNAK
jgi:hypothetical protein